MPCCATANPGHRVRAERRSHGSQTGHGDRRVKAASRLRRGRDSARLEPAIDAAENSAIASTLDLQDSRSLAQRPAPSLCRAVTLGGSQIDLEPRGYPEKPYFAGATSIIAGSETLKPSLAITRTRRGRSPSWCSVSVSLLTFRPVATVSH